MSIRDHKLFLYLLQNTQLNEEVIEKVLSKFTISKFLKGEYFHYSGEFYNKIVFVEKGLLRQYAIDKNGKEYTIQFVPENWFVSDKESIYLGQPSSFFIQTLEDSEVYLLSMNFYDELFLEHTSFTNYNAKLLHRHILQLQRRINQLLSATAEERYLDFIKMYPNIMQRVPLGMVASYLGITPESLSRVRKTLTEKKHK